MNADKRFEGKLMMAFLTALLIATFAPLAWPGSAFAAGPDVSVDATRAATGKLTMKKGSTYNLGVKAAKGAKVTYKSSKPRVVKLLGKGKVKALKTGKATITITAKKDGAKATKRIKVTVVKAKKFKKVKSIAANKRIVTLAVGQSTGLKVTFKPAKASNKNLIYKSSNPKVLSVSNTGAVKGLQPGSSRVTIVSAGNKKAKAIVTFTVSSDSGKKVKTSSQQAYAAEVSALVKKYDNQAEINASSTDQFSSGRLLVQLSSPDVPLDNLGAIASVVDSSGSCVLQFASSRDARNAQSILQKLDGVQYSEPDIRIRPTGSVTAATSYRSWGVAKMHADTLASAISASGATRNAVVAVVDTGVSSHPFLGSRVLAGGYDFVDGDADPSDVAYSAGHGTHVSGTIVDCTSGLSVEILPVRVLGPDGGSRANVANGVRYAADHGANVINMSLGGEGNSITIGNAVAYAIEKGVTVVVSAGNEDDDTAGYCPAHISEAIVVSAVDENLERASFSNWGESVDISAPGVKVESCVPGGGYERWNGTSMAAPHISAAAAMIKLKNPAYTPAQIEHAIRGCAIDLGSSGWDPYYGTGFPDLSKLVIIEPTGVRLNNTSATIQVGNTTTLTATVLPSNATDKTVTWSSSNTSVATVSGGKVTGKAAGTATITARTSNGKTATCGVTVTGIAVEQVILSTNTPVISRVPFAGSMNQTTINAEILPHSASDKSLSWRSSNTSIATVSNTGNVTAVDEGPVTITATASNGVSSSFVVYVLGYYKTGFAYQKSSARDSAADFTYIDHMSWKKNSALPKYTRITDPSSLNLVQFMDIELMYGTTYTFEIYRRDSSVLYATRSLTITQPLEGYWFGQSMSGLWIVPVGSVFNYLTGEFDVDYTITFPNNQKYYSSKDSSGEQLHFSL